MAKQINFEFEGNEYTLEFSRSTIRRMERNGFDAHKAEGSPMSSVYELFAGAFRMHHPNLDSRKIERMFDSLSDLDGWADDFGEMYGDTFKTLSDEKSEGEIKRTKNW